MNDRNVAIYARVSTEHEAQLSALENQKDWYAQYLDAHPEWHLVHMYVDEGITGTSAEKRPNFMRMMEDARNGDFDLIITREVSRFARNTVDTLIYTRKLRAINVEVFFVSDNIKTFDADGELRLTIMATLAQDESRKTSMRVKSGQKISMENGVFYGNGNILGYDRVGKELVINEEQARTVRTIFDLYLSGYGLRKIQFELEERGYLTSTGNMNWHPATIGHILKNPFYCGIIKYRKQYVPDFLEQKKINNIGDVENIVVKGSHEPIISEDDFKQVQTIMESHRRKQTNNISGKHRLPLGERPPVNVWTKLLVCECGHKFHRRMWHKYGDIKQYGYQCYGTIKTGTKKTREKKGLPTDGVCEVQMISEWKLQMMAKYVFKTCMLDTNRILDMSMEMLENHMNDEDTDNSELITKKEAELKKLRKRLNNLIEMRADGDITREVFREKKQDIEEKITKVEDELLDLNGEEHSEPEVDIKERLAILRYTLETFMKFDYDEDIPEQIIDAFVRKIVVTKDGFEWYLRFSPDDSPCKVTVDGKRKNGAKISAYGDMQDRLLLTISSNYTIVHIQYFDLNYAKEYVSSCSVIYRILNWHDFSVKLFI